MPSKSCLVILPCLILAACGSSPSQPEDDTIAGQLAAADLPPPPEGGAAILSVAATLADSEMDPLDRAIQCVVALRTLNTVGLETGVLRGEAERAALARFIQTYRDRATAAAAEADVSEGDVRTRIAQAEEDARYEVANQASLAGGCLRSLDA